MVSEYEPGVLELKAIMFDLYHIAEADYTYPVEGPCFVDLLSLLERAAPHLVMPQQQNAEMKQIVETTLSAAMQFLCTPRSRRERVAMLMKPCRCPYSQRSGQGHKIGDALFSTAPVPLSRRLPPLVFVERLLKLVEAACDVRFAAMHGRTMRVDRIRKRKTWPRSIDDILPYGPENTVRGLLGWLAPETGYYARAPGIYLYGATTITPKWYVH
jgi:hypothetical protein